MRNYKVLNNAFGWVAFLIAAFTYLSTIESTASLWDCGEFISSGYKLEVGHAPGAPLFMMLIRLFSFFAPSPQYVPVLANAMSALMSAFTILFLFWSISHLARKLVNKKTEDFVLNDYIVVFGSAMVGALAYTFSDTFWFSAVEGEVYATSSLITAIVFWAILKWEECADERYANRWLVLIAYITGLSIGVHLLNLLAVPAIVFVYYFRKYPVTKGGIVKTSLISVLLLGFLIWVLIPGIPKVASWFELPFVNSMGLPVNSGVMFFIMILAAGLIYAIYYTHKKRKLLLNTIWLCLTMIILGYGSYAMIVIRSAANPPMDQNNPDNIFALISYLNRDQYGDRPLISGQYYNAPTIGSTDEFSYVLVKGKYEKAGWKQKAIFDPQYTTVFPRMFSDKPEHVAVYKHYVKKGNIVLGATEEQAIVPKFSENIVFFLDYQIGYMYWRYFMWNFAGRQNDLKASKGDPTRGNWLSGIKFIDEARLGTQDNQPQFMNENKGRNVYYMLPLLLGLLGLAYQFTRDKRNFTVVMLLFVLTGIAIVIYLNQAPNEPRERDYAYAGSFYAFAIWIGLGMMALYELLRKVTPATAASGIAAVVSLFAAPVLMAQQNWDDHDRSGRYVASDFGYNYLNSCDEQALVMVYGDNDTFPLWYNQEVEEQRTDVRVTNTMYLGADWYYEQMMRKNYTSERVKMTATEEKIAGERRLIIPVNAQIKEAINANLALNFVMSDDAKNKQLLRQGVTIMGESKINYFPSKYLFKPINKQDAIAKGLVPAADTAYVSSAIVMTLPETVYKNSLAIVDFVANNFMERPIYFGLTLPSEYQMGLSNNLLLEGLAYKLVPYNTYEAGRLNVEKTYDLMMNKFRFRGLNDSKVYLDETARNQTAYYRKIFMDLAETFNLQGKTDTMRAVLAKFDETLPVMVSPYLYQTNPILRLYWAAGETGKATELTNKLRDEYVVEINYYLSLMKSRYDMSSELSMALSGLRNLGSILKTYNQSELQKTVDDALANYQSLLKQ